MGSRVRKSSLEGLEGPTRAVRTDAIFHATFTITVTQIAFTGRNVMDDHGNCWVQLRLLRTRDISQTYGLEPIDLLQAKERIGTSSEKTSDFHMIFIKDRQSSGSAAAQKSSTLLAESPVRARQIIATIDFRA